MLIASAVEVGDCVGAGDGVGVSSTTACTGESVPLEHPIKVKMPRVTSNDDVNLVIA
jgi:hypothetical protein